MIFSSLEFVFFFLPIVLGVFFAIGSSGAHTLALAWLTLASLFFYSYWNPKYLFLILISIGINYAIGLCIQSFKSRSLRFSKALMVLGVIFNVGLLGYYKYVNFLVENLNAIAGTDIVIKQIILPLGISFFTFQQIAYIVDVYRGHITDNNFLRYCLFVTFFPQLIAGPIVHHDEVMPQFAQQDILKPNARAIAIGITIFTIGLFKKVIIADGIAPYANEVFKAAESAKDISFFAAWLGAIAYTFQLYFDFSGYADMSIGIGQMLNIKLPLNFFSPYKSVDMIDFWRRWHMTLSRFLRDYIYIPLGGNRKGHLRRYLNLIATMLIGGFWHGAGWTFVIWGAMHGFYLAINYAWRGLSARFGLDNQQSAKGWRSLLAIGVTFIAVVFAWVVFRAESLTGAIYMFQSMLGMHGFSSISTQKFLKIDMASNLLLGLAILVTFVCPNTYQLLERFRPALETYRVSAPLKFQHSFRWIPTQAWSIVIGLMFGVSVLGMSKVSEFLYFQF